MIKKTQTSFRMVILMCRMAGEEYPLELLLAKGKLIEL